MPADPDKRVGRKLLPRVLRTGLAGVLLYVVYELVSCYFVQPTYLEVMALAQSADGRWVATGLDAFTGSLFGFGPAPRPTSRRYVRVIDIDALRVVPQPLVHERGVIWSVAFAPDASFLVSASEEETGSVKFWKTDTGELLGALDLAPDTGCGVAVSPDGKRVAVAPCAGDALTIIDAASRRRLNRIPMANAFSHDFELDFLADSRHLVVHQKHRGALIVDIDDPADTFLVDCNDRLHGTQYVVAPGRRYLAMSCMADDVNATQLWDLEERRVVATLPLRYRMALADHAIALGDAGGIDLYTVPDGKFFFRMPSYGPGMTFLGLAFSPDERSLAMAGGLKNTVRLWDLQGKRLAWEYRQGDPDFGRVLFNKSGTRLAATLGSAILPAQVNARPYLKVFDVATGRDVLAVTHDRRDEVPDPRYRGAARTR